MEQHDEARWEFRVFGPDLTDLSAAIAADAGSCRMDGGREIYLVSRLRPDANVKLRDGRIETKSLLTRQGLVELWRPAFRGRLPVAASAVSEHVLDPLAICHEPRQGSVALEDLLRMLRDEPGVVLVEIAKSRRRFDLGRELAEHVQIEVAGRPVESIAIEGSDRAGVESRVRMYGLEHRTNCAYPAYLRSVLSRDNPRHRAGQTAQRPSG